MVQLWPGVGVGEASASPSPASSRKDGRICGLGALTVLTAVLTSAACSDASAPSGRALGRMAGAGGVALAAIGGTAGCLAWGPDCGAGLAGAASPWCREK